METMERTLAFAKHLLFDVAPGSFECSASFLTPLPGTDIRARPEAYGIKLLDPDLLTSSNFNFCTVETDELGQDAINNFQRRFLEEIGQGLFELMPTLPRNRIDAHARLLHRFNVVTAYGQRLGEYPRLKEYFDVVGDDKLEPASQLNDDDLLHRFPTRISSAVQIDDGKMTVLRGPTELRLNEFGSRVFALCSGKRRRAKWSPILLNSSAATILTARYSSQTCFSSCAIWTKTTRSSSRTTSGRCPCLTTAQSTRSFSLSYV